MKRAILVTLIVKSWSGAKTDKEVTQDTLTRHNASRGAGRFTKQLLDKEWLLPITKHQGRARAELNKISLPWGGTGSRLISPQKWHEWQTTFAGIRKDFDTEVGNLLREYASLRTKAAHDLGDMFNPDEYPDEDTLASRFDLAFETTMVDLDADTSGVMSTFRDAIAEEATASYKAAANAATRDGLARMKDAVDGLIERVKAYDAGELKRLRSGPFQAIEVAVDALESVAQLGGKDRLLEQVRQLRDKLAYVEPEVVKAGASERQRVLSDAQEVTSVLGALMCAT